MWLVRSDLSIKHRWPEQSWPLRGVLFNQKHWFWLLRVDSIENCRGAFEAKLLRSMDLKKIDISSLTSKVVRHILENLLEQKRQILLSQTHKPQKSVLLSNVMFICKHIHCFETSGIRKSHYLPKNAKFKTLLYWWLLYKNILHFITLNLSTQQGIRKAETF